ncbi:MAG TPA: hypothetical protein ENF46_00525 [Candidatus Acetothermia bacterium]|nr:hypothetical protein [Candidatus Acetothermia bacterium]
MKAERVPLSTKLVSKNRGDWYDPELKRAIFGTIYRYEIRDPLTGTWIVEVRITSDPLKATACLVSSESSSGVHIQLRSKSIVFIPCREDRESFYHVLGIAYLQESGRLCYRRIKRPEDVPEEIKRSYTLDLYENVSPHPGNRTYRGKIVTLVPKSAPEKMAELFILEKVHPISGNLET